MLLGILQLLYHTFIITHRLVMVKLVYFVCRLQFGKRTTVECCNGPVTVASVRSEVTLRRKCSTYCLTYIVCLLP